MPSSTEVFNMYELVSLIFEHTATYDLLVYQRLNKTSQALIKDTPLFQAKLFLKVELSTDSHVNKVRGWNPFINLLCKNKCKEASKCFEISGEGLKAFDRPTASWSSMFLSNPALTEVEVCVWGGCKPRELSIKSDTGVTIGLLAETQKEGSQLRPDPTANEYLHICTWLRTGRR